MTNNFKTVIVVMLSTLCLTAIVWGTTSVTHKMMSHDSTYQSAVVDEAPTKSSEQSTNDGNNGDMLLWSVLFD